MGCLEGEGNVKSEVRGGFGGGLVGVRRSVRLRDRMERGMVDMMIEVEDTEELVNRYKKS